MKLTNQCPRCGGELKEINDNYKCSYCNALYEKENVINIREELNNLLDELKQEKVASLRTRLWEAVHDKYQSKEKIVSISREIRNYLPDDFLACFYETVNTKPVEEVNNFLNSIDYENNYNLMDLVIEYMITIIEESNLLALNNLIENTYKSKDLLLYEKYSTLLSKEAEKLESGIYELNITRDVFIAYSSKDMKYVEEVVKALEKEGLTCFVAMRNLRHGKGAVENYDKAIEKAIDNSKVFLFISTPNSRSRSCDAFTKEMPYVKKRDIELAPANLRQNYDKLPHKYKKPRVQYVIGEKPGGGFADKAVNEFFNGIEWCYSVDRTVEAICKTLDEEVIEEEKENKNVLVLNKKTKFIILGSIIGVIVLAFLAIIIGISISNNNSNTSNSTNNTTSTSTNQNTYNTEVKKVIQLLNGRYGLQMCVGDTYTLPVKINYDIPKGSSIYYDESIISFNRENNEIKALKSGNTEFYVEDINGVKSNVIKVFVYKISYNHEGETILVYNKKSGVITEQAEVKNPVFILEDRLLDSANPSLGTAFKLNFECDIKKTYSTNDNIELMFELFDENGQLVAKFVFNSPSLVLNEEKHIVVKNISSSKIYNLSTDMQTLTCEIYIAPSG